MTEVLSTFESVILTNADYCILCFRSARERKLVKPAYFSKLLRALCDGLQYEHQEHRKLCYLCERWASAAGRLARAAALSLELHTLYGHMARASGARLKNPKVPSGYDLTKMSTSLAAVKTASILLQTEVLTLLCHDSRTTKEQAEPSETDNICVILDDGEGEATQIDTHTRNVLAQREIQMDRVVIIDEDDPLEFASRPPTPSILPDSPPTPPNIILDSPSPPPTPPDILPHSPSLPPDIIIPDSPSPLSPTSANVVKVGPTLVPIQRLLPVQLDYQPKYLLHPIIENEGSVSVPSLSAQIVNGQIIKADNSTLVLQTPMLALRKGSQLEFVMKHREVEEILKNLDPHNKDAVSPGQALPQVHVAIELIQNPQFDGYTPNDSDLLNMSVLNSSNLPIVINNNATLLNASLFNNSNVPMWENSITDLSNTTLMNISNVPIVINNNADLSNKSPLLNNSNMPISVNNNSSSTNSNSTFLYKLLSQNAEEPDRSSDTAVIDLEKEKEDNARGAKRRKQDAYTDWEDKIPMDVISLTDATDPNARTALATPGAKRPLGIISDVRSIGHSDRNLGTGHTDNVGTNVSTNVGTNVSTNVGTNIMANVDTNVSTNVTANVGTNVSKSVTNFGINAVNNTRARTTTVSANVGKPSSRKVARRGRRAK